MLVIKRWLSIRLSSGTVTGCEMAATWRGAGKSEVVTAVAGGNWGTGEGPEEPKRLNQSVDGFEGAGENI